MPDNQTTTTPAAGLASNAAVRHAPLAVDPRAVHPERADAVVPTAAKAFVPHPVPAGLPSAKDVTPRSAIAWQRYKIKVLTAGGQPLKQERCILITPGDRNAEGRTNDAGIVEFTVAAPPTNPLLNVSAGLVSPPLLLLPDILEEFYRPGEADAQFPGVPSLQELKHGLDARFRYRRGDRVSHVVIALGSGEAQVRVNRLTEQEKFEHFRWSYVSNNAAYVVANPGDYITRNARWEWGRGAVCNQHVNFFLGYWFNLNTKFTASGSGTDTAYLPLLDCGTGKFPYHGETKTHRGYQEFVEPVLDFHAATYLPVFNDLEFPGRQEITKQAKRGDATPVTSADGKTKYDVYPERYVKYIRLSQFIDWKTRKLNARGQQLLDALADFNVYSVAEFYEADPNGQKNRRDGALARTRSWLKKYRALPHLQVYTLPRAGKPVALAELTDAELNAMSDSLLWEVMWKLDDDRAEDAALLADLRTGLNVDHHAGVAIKRAPGGGPLPPNGGPVELYKFSADQTPRNIQLKKFVESVGAPGKEPLFTHYAFWKLKPLRAGGFAPIPTVPGSSGSLDLEAPPRFIDWI